MLWLALFGLAHFFLVWWGDILFLYAVIGCIAFAFRGLEADPLIRLALILYGLGFAIMLLLSGSLLLFEWAGGASDVGTDAATIAGEIALYQGGYATILQHRLFDQWSYPLTSIGYNALETLPLMLLGTGLYKNGFLAGEWTQAEYRRWALRGIGGGGGGFVLLAGIGAANDYADSVMINIFTAWSLPFRLLMTLGYAAALILVIQRWSTTAIMTRVAAAGRAAFSNYLGTSIIMTSIFYGYGLGLFGQLGRAELYLFVPPMGAVMLLWSAPWLTRFHYGPLEWLWRSLARGRPQPFRKSPTTHF
jgi:uncharacterized protein